MILPSLDPLPSVISGCASTAETRYFSAFVSIGGKRTASTTAQAGGDASSAQAKRSSVAPSARGNTKKHKRSNFTHNGAHYSDDFLEQPHLAQTALLIIAEACIPHSRSRFQSNFTI